MTGTRPTFAALAAAALLSCTHLLSQGEARGRAVAPGAGPAAAEAEQKEEKTKFDVILKHAGPKKILVIKEVRALTNSGLKEAKDLVDGAPKLLKEGVTKEEADKIKQVIEAAGGIIETKEVREEVIFQDKLSGKLADGWSWIREDRKGWRLSEQGLEIRVQPGNMWGKSNDAKNLLLRPAPDASGAGVVAEVTVKTEPTGQYEQAGLAWYHDDSHMVKLVKELVDGKVHLVMGREEGDRTQTIALLPRDGLTFHLRLQAKGNRVTGFFRTDEKSPWVEAGSCDLPGKGPAKVCLQAYNGPSSAEHWSVFSGFVLSRGR